MNVFPVDAIVTGLGSDGLPEYDRAYTAEELRAVYAKFFKNGVFGGEGGQLAVSANATQGVAVGSGSCIINGAVGIEESQRTLVLQVAHESLDRIDTVVARLDLNIDRRECDLYVIQGTPGVSPVRPELTRNESVWELGLADVYVRAGTTSVSSERITDTRSESERCGWAAPFVELDTTGYFTQLEAATDAAVEAMKDALDETTAGKLQSDIDELGATALVQERGTVSDLTLSALAQLEPGTYDVSAGATGAPEGEQGGGSLMLSKSAGDRLSAMLTYDEGDVYAAAGTVEGEASGFKKLALWDSVSQACWTGNKSVAVEPRKVENLAFEFPDGLFTEVPVVIPFFSGAATNVGWGSVNLNAATRSAEGCTIKIFNEGNVETTVFVRVVAMSGGLFA